MARTLGVVTYGTLAVTASAASSLMKGISYGPTPVFLPAEASQMPEDDYFCDEAAPMWSSSGRGDLEIIRDMGANLVRLYGNDPRNSHAAFLDEADALGLQVAPGMSDWPYTQKMPGSCKDTDYNCFEQVKPLYMDNLRNGFLTAAGEYHTSLRVMNILNEPDLKLPPTATTGGAEGPRQMARALVSAFDAMLDAEKDLGVSGRLINFTATFSYAVCSACDRFKGSPALGQMAQLDDAMRNPAAYGYTPRNDITTAYLSRFMHSFNTQNPATDLQHQFLDDYALTFPTIPVYIGEYHRVLSSQTEDLGMILEIAENNELFVGISFFEFTRSYYKTGSEMDFGMFGYGDQTVATMDYFGKRIDVLCLSGVPNPESGMLMAEAVAIVFGGSIDTSKLCPERTTTEAPTTSWDESATPAPAPASTSTATSTTTTSTTTMTKTTTTSTSTTSTPEGLFLDMTSSSVLACRPCAALRAGLAALMAFAGAAALR